MKKLVYLMVAGIFSCQTEKNTDLSSLPEQDDGRLWTVYEGRVPLGENSSLYLELSMFPSELPGEGRYQLAEYTEAGDEITPLSSLRGMYSSVAGETPEQLYLQLHNSAREDGVTRIYEVNGFSGVTGNSKRKMIREEVFRKTDLVVSLHGQNTLVVLDQHMNPITLEPYANLTKRASRLFTVEGYFRHNGDTADFTEMNTMERWAVSKHGDYMKAIRQYHQLTTVKFEPTYIKAIGFAIRHKDKDHHATDALVFKKVLQMTTVPTPQQ